MPYTNGDQSGGEQVITHQHKETIRISIAELRAKVKRIIKTHDNELNLGEDPDLFIDYYLEDHHETDAEECVAVGRKVAAEFDFNEDDIESIRNTALLHDNSKVKFLIYRKKVFTKEDQTAMREHAFEAACAVLVCMDFTDKTAEDELWDLFHQIWHHHEWWLLVDKKQLLRCLVVNHVDMLVGRMEDRGDRIGLPQDQALVWLLTEIARKVPQPFREMYAWELEVILRAIVHTYDKDENGQYRRTIDLRRNKKRS